jgi:hypothetical protein
LFLVRSIFEEVETLEKGTGGIAMEQITIPTGREIATMSSERCQYMRIRLKNEISFARGDEAIGGGSNEEAVAAYKRAIEMIEQRSRELASLGAGGDQSVGAAASSEAHF